MAARRVLVTGLSGLIGTALRKHVEGRYALRALNRRAVPGVETHQADLGDLDAVKPAFAGVHTVVHLAAAAGDNQLPADIMRSNVAGAYNVFEAARLAGVTRVIFASSGATVSGWEREPPLSHLVAGRYDQLGEWKPLTHESPLRPSGLYGASKIWGEALARHYADAYGMSAICLRIGRVRAEDRPTNSREMSVWCSQRDVVRMIATCIEAPASVRFDVFYVVSDNRWSYRDVEHPRAVLGWTPVDRAEDHRA
ncbi:MAG TPA: NAD-dependent epimerase/dehydratase family protein [Methylomirabilota bacterium]|nr:NAD-dependent epimerase/dehydratase family protein [Methylomirabilota bacterium]